MNGTKLYQLSASGKYAAFNDKAHRRSTQVFTSLEVAGSFKEKFLHRTDQRVS